ncbi:multiple epidermal growth factor-like domains protein 11 isoform X2 [Corticium candelabrum]|uniref:multiple epidermal growth factor-like domains protein 11 isoform X2 n=1 Tax=Corticium candelabrum TaxID=121492 RepID=UPI002E25FBA7|nr:multiple epidermal growth factor-like domains protein 11 isoform X2 [Corticium candelabrum]
MISINVAFVLKCSSIDGKCTCKPGYRGRLCNALCQPGTYGDGCKKCNCSANAAGCNVFTGKCSCPAEYGALCDQLCATGWWGPGCINKCTCDNGTCGGVTGRCTCNPGYTGSTCNNPCAV